MNKKILYILQIINQCKYRKNKNNEYIFSKYSNINDGLFYNIRDEHKLVNSLFDKGYIDGKLEIIIDDNDVNVDVIINGEFCKNQIKIRGLTSKGVKLMNAVGIFRLIRWYSDMIQSYLKEYDEITKLILQLFVLLITILSSFCSGAVAAYILNHLFK